MNKGLLLALILISFAADAQEIKLIDLKTDYRVNPSGVGAKPALGWVLQSSKRGVRQSGYRILVSEDSVDLEKNAGTFWDSKKQPWGSSICTPYAGPALSAGKTYYWKVMVWDSARRDSSHWSHIARFQTGLWMTSDWSGAKFISYDILPDSSIQIPAPSVKGVKKTGPFRDVLPVFRKEFMVDKPLLRATVFISGLGQFELSCNGAKVGDHFLDPGWVTYDKKALYVPLDITRQLKQGVNALGVMLGNGFYYIPRERYHKLITAYGYPRLIAKVVLEYRDGTERTIVSDESWKTAPGPITYSSIYGGEDYDARMEQHDWDQPGFDARGWKSPAVVGEPGSAAANGRQQPILEAQQAEPLKVMDSFSVKRVVQKSSGVWIYDLGQNASGIVRLRVSGVRGSVVRITPAELPEGDTAVNQKGTGKPYYWEYTLKGEGVESWSPRFTYYGFRYLQVEATANGALPEIKELVGLHTRNAATEAGKFDCSDPLFNRIDTLIKWSIKSNLASVMTDCPHREKLGWLEEAHLMGSSIRYNYDIAALYRKMVHDMMDAQTEDGLVPEIAPEYTVFGEPFRDSPEWGSSAILVPWYLFEYYGDSQTLEEAYPMMRKYIQYLNRQTKDGILYEGLGDWYDIGPKHPGFSQLTPKGVTATAIYFYVLRKMEFIASLLNKVQDSREYYDQSKVVETAFQKQFYNAATGEVASGSQTSYAIALYVNLIPKTDTGRVLNNLLDSLKANKYSLTAGDIGFRYLLQVLHAARRDDVIYAMNNRSDVPGYGYQLARGATALTESWQALPSVSNDHLMLGHLMEWLYEGLGGIHQDGFGISAGEYIIRPAVVGNMQWAQVDYQSPYGLISSHWKKLPGELVKGKRVGATFDLWVTVPGNTKARIVLPAGRDAVITEGWTAVEKKKDIKEVLRNDSVVIYSVGSGSYYFRAVSGVTVDQATMQKIYDEVKTPYKYGLVVVPPEHSRKMDCPTIFRKGDSWYMSYILFDGRGYETWLAKSPDLLHWETLGKLMSFSDTTGRDSVLWDANQKAGYLALIDYDWGGDYKLKEYKGKYWMSYFGGNTKGYEAGILSEGMAFTDKDPTTAHEWQRLDHPILSVKDKDVAWWDDHTMYKSWVMRDPRKLTGHEFLLYYNANGDSLDKRRGAERIGMAVSDDMIHWSRQRRDPVLDHGPGITGDPYIQKMGGLYVMFYFGAFWKGKGGAFNRFASSYDLVHWTDWTGPDLISSSEPYDEVFAHKSYVVKFNGVVYHFYCGVDKKGNRGIAVATSKDMGKSTLNYR